MISYVLLKIINNEMRGWLVAESWEEMQTLFNDIKQCDSDIKDFELPDVVPSIPGQTQLSDTITLLVYRNPLR